MYVIGVIGGIASGKSEITRMFERLGALRIDADKLGHDALENPAVQAKLLSRWGNKILEAGTLSRKAVARIVFADEGASDLAFLESVTHPFIEKKIRATIADAKRNQEAAVVLDAAIVVKAEWDKHCDHIVFVDVPYTLRQERVLRRGWTKEQFDSRESAQLSLDKKRALAQSFVDNSGTLEETFEQVRDVWTCLVQAATR